MSVDSVKAFFQQVQTDDALKASMKSINATNRDEAVAEIIRIAATAGFRFSRQDYEQATQAHVGPPGRRS